MLLRLDKVQEAKHGTAVKRERARHESPILHHLKQIEQSKSEPSGSFLMLSRHSSLREIIICLNLAIPISAIPFLANLTSSSM